MLAMAYIVASNEQKDSLAFRIKEQPTRVQNMDAGVGNYAGSSAKAVSVMYKAWTVLPANMRPWMAFLAAVADWTSKNRTKAWNIHGHSLITWNPHSGYFQSWYESG